MLRRLLAFKRLYDTTVVRPYSRVNVGLASWVRAQRALQAAGRLSPDRYRALEEMGFWTDHAKEAPPRGRPRDDPPPDPRLLPGLESLAAPALELKALEQRALGADLEPPTLRGARGQRLAAEWRGMYLEFLRFRADHPVGSPPDLPPWKALRAWVMAQRLMRRRGLMTHVRGELLDAARFEWEGTRGFSSPRRRAALDAQWDHGFEEVMAFKMATGHTSPSPGVASTRLCHWVTVQRRHHKLGTLRPDRLRRLEAIGFEWSAPPGGRDDADWEAQFEKLSAFRQREGHCRVPIRRPEDPVLSSWVRHQRVLYWKRQLDPSRQARLEALGFDWDQREGGWQAMYGRLQRYKQDHGNATPPSRYAPDSALGSWCVAMRSQGRKGVLREDRRQLLDALGFEWWLRPEAPVEEPVARLLEFRRQHGHFALAHVAGQELLARWAAEARFLGVKGALDPKLFDALDEAGFPWDREQAHWEAQFAKVKDLVESGRGLPERSALFSWCQAQRAHMAAGKLDGEREQRLLRVLEP